MGLVTNYAGLVSVRFLLGVAGMWTCNDPPSREHFILTILRTEAGLFPGVNYYLSCWYKRSEFGIRAAIFFSAAALAIVIAPLLFHPLMNFPMFRVTCK